MCGAPLIATLRSRMALLMLRRAATGAPLFDPSESDASGWYPINDPTASVTTVVEAARDLRMLLGGEEPRDEVSERRLKLVVTPLHSFGVAVQQLRRRVDALQTTLPLTSKRDPRLRALGRDLGRALEGDLRTVRNQRAAHHDPDELRSPAVSPEMLLDCLRPALGLWFLLMKVRGVYGWTKPNADGAELDVMAEWPPGLLLSSGSLSAELLPHDPRRHVFEEIEETVFCHNRLAMACSPTGTIIEVTLPH